MRRFALLMLALLTIGCASSRAPQPPPPGRLTLQVSPNPIVAVPLGDDRWQFDFDVVVREDGGSDVTIDRVSADVVAFGGLRVASAELDRAELVKQGYASRVAAGHDIRYHFSQKHAVPDEHLLDAVKAEVLIEGTDAAGQQTVARTTVTVRRK